MDFKNEIDKEANLWLVKENEGLNKDEERELDKWLQNKNHKKYYEKNRHIIQECLSLDDDFINEMENEIFTKGKQNNIFYRSRYIAASIILTCMILFGSYKIDSYYNPSFSQNYISSNEKILNISLPDNTIVDIDVKSVVEIKYYDHKRTVSLNNGKALFWVTKNREKPFFVKSGNTLIEVLGTKFEVIHFNDSTQINVLEGLVRVDHLSNNKKKKTIIQLKKSETLTLNNSGKVLNYTTMDINKIANWKQDIINFNQTSLKEAAVIFERYSNQKVKFENYELSQLTISGKFSTSHYQSFLDSIQLIYPIRIIKEDNIIKIVNN